MKWKKFTIETTTAAVDFISQELSDLGIEGIEIEDHVPLSDQDTKGMFIDILPELPPDDGSARVSFYLPGDQETADLALNGGDAPHMGCRLTDHRQVLADVRKALEEVKGFVNAGSCAIQETETQDEDWINNWKNFFHPFTVGRFLIKPTWEEIPPGEEEKICLTIDPGTAFGTGTHETTQLCIAQMERYLHPGDRVLDVGTGSGILAIAALKMGAREALGTELDEYAVKAARENGELNGVADRFRVETGNILEEPAVQELAGRESVDLAVSNILAPVILLLQGEIGRHVKPGGIWISSGIIQEKEEEVRDGFRRHPEWQVLEVTHQGEWVSFTARKI